MDFGKEDRNKVLQFVINEYGQERVASLGSFQYIWAKGAIKDIGRVLGVPFEITNEMTSHIDKETIKEVIELGLLDKYKEKYPELFIYAEKLAGLPKAFSAHPCFTEDTLVMTDNGFKKIIDVNVGDKVLTHKNRYKEVLDVMKNSTEELYFIKLGGLLNNRYIRCTGNHPFCIEIKNDICVWKDAKSLTTEDYLISPPKFFARGEYEKIPIKSIEKIKCKPIDVYNLSVLDDNTYTANNVIVHNCGKVIAMDEISYYNATDINDDGEVIIQGDMHTADDLGLIKADFLGLRTVDVIYDCLDMIGKDYQYIAPHNLDFEDAKVWESFRNGFTSGIFQFESGGMKDTLKKIDCSCIEDLTVANALFRPGSMKFIDNYGNRKMGTEEITYIHPDLESILKNSYGIIVYQEQLIEIGRLAKLSNPDKLRKATGKKNPKLLAEIKPELYKGLSDRGWTQEQLDQLWDTMLDFAKYSFNKSHAAAYAMIAYICMYLKTYHPKEFMCSWINSVSNVIEKVAECIDETKRLGIKIYLGKYNNCSPVTTLYKDGIMVGTNTFKYCNSNIANELMLLSKNHYDNFIQLLDDINEHTSINTRQLEILTGLNFFSDFGKNKYLLNVIDYYNGKETKDEETKKKIVLIPPIRTCKQIKKEKLEDFAQYGLTEAVVKMYSEKETAKQYSQIDNVGLLCELMKKIPNESMDIYEYIKFEKTYLNYVTYHNPKIANYYYMVVDFRTLKDVTKPYVTLKNLCTGEEVKTRIRQSKIFKAQPFGEFAVLRVDSFFLAYKKKPINGVWTTTNETELILDEYEVISNSSVL